ncbi:hypothetical protein MRX96_002491 [Rhipicephalus microplus]
MDATEDQESQKTSTTPLSNQRSSRSSTSKRRADASVRSKARSSDKSAKEASENDSKVDTDNSRSSSSTTETHKHKSKKRKKKSKDKIDGAFATSSTKGVSAVATAAMFPEFSPGPQLTITPSRAIDADSEDGDIRISGRIFTVIAVVVVIIGILFKHKDATTTAPCATASATSARAVSTTEASGDRVRTVTEASTSWTEAPSVSSVESPGSGFESGEPPMRPGHQRHTTGPRGLLTRERVGACPRLGDGGQKTAASGHDAGLVSRGTNNLLEWEILAAKADTVVMSPNVRLGVLGYLGRTSPA